MSLFSLRDFSVTYGARRVVDSISLDVGPGECFAIVGESGSGKSQTVLSAFGLGTGLVSGLVSFDGSPLQGYVRALMGARVGFVFQQPLSALTPHMTIGAQLAESAGTRDRVMLAALLDEVRLSEPAARLRQYPHELSGGMRQRVMIAMALARRPDLLIADEPTTALDVLVAREILDLLDELRRARGLALVLISHDLALVSGRAERIAVMQAGRIVETGPAADVLAHPAHDYTRRLLAAAPRLDTPVPPLPATGDILLHAHDVGVDFTLPGSFLTRSRVTAVDGVSLCVARGEALGIVGASGSGKSTLIRALARLGPMTRGHIELDGKPLPVRQAMRPADRRAFQMVFQDPVDSLDPMMRVGDIVAEPLRTLRPDIAPTDHAARVAAVLGEVGLNMDHAAARPRQLSGGQAQRVAIARALISEPDLLICDEATSALDVSVQAEVIETLAGLQHGRGLAMLFVTHDLALVRRLCHRVIVMEHGRVVETGPTADVIAAPATDYARRLIAAAPVLRSPQ